MPRLARGDEKPPMSAEARRWWPAPSEERELGGRSELEPSGVLLRWEAMWLADMMAGGCSSEIRQHGNSAVDQRQRGPCWEEGGGGGGEQRWRWQLALARARATHNVGR